MDSNVLVLFTVTGVRFLQVFELDQKTLVSSILLRFLLQIMSQTLEILQKILDSNIVFMCCGCLEFSQEILPTLKNLLRLAKVFQDQVLIDQLLARVDLLVPERILLPNRVKKLFKVVECLFL